MKKIISLMLLILTITFLALSTSIKSVSAKISPDANGNWYWDYVSKLDEDYYKSLTGITEATAFKKELGRIISTGVNRISYGGSSTGKVIAEMDEDPNNANNCLCMYTGVSYAKSSVNSAWNQEHTWAKSHGFKADKSNYAYSDIHHLRVTEQKINSSRSNSDFGEVNHSSSKSDNYGNYWTSSTFEPRDAVKGDVARIIFYMETRYQAGNPNNPKNIDLRIVNKNTGTSEGKGELGFLDTLMKWHVEDPVDDLERRRNDVGEANQGNRNPYIDHPEYADIVYGTNYAEVNGGSSIERTYKVTYVTDNETLFDYHDDTKYKLDEKIKTPDVIPTKKGYVFSGWYTDSALTKAYDFNTTVKGNVTLYPRFIEKELTITEFLEVAKVDAKLSFLVNEEEIIGSVPAETKTLNVSPIKATPSNKYSVRETIDLTEYMSDEVNSLFKIEGKTNAKEYFSIPKVGVFRLYNASGDGSEIVITAKNGLTIKNVTVNPANDNLKVTVNGDTASIKNINSASKSNIEITDFTITYETNGSKPTYHLVDDSLNVSYRIEVPSYLATTILNKDDFKVYNGTVELNYEVNKNANSYYIIVNIKAQKDEVLDVRFTYKGTILKSEYRSVKELAQIYLEKYSSNSTVSKYKTILEELAK